MDYIAFIAGLPEIARDDRKLPLAMEEFREQFLAKLQENMKNAQTEFKELKKKLLSTKKNGYDRPLDEAAMEAYCQGYKAFLDAGKTERECVAEGIRLAQAKGFQPYVRGMALKAGGQDLPEQP